MNPLTRRVVAVSIVALLSACGPGYYGNGGCGDTPQQTPRSNMNPNPSSPSSPAPTYGAGAVRVENASYESLWYLYISPASASDWGQDQLGDSVIVPGASLTITDVPSGTYDLKAVTEDGSEAYVWSFSVVSGSTTRITISN